jgi:hypothetical protein
MILNIIENFMAEINKDENREYINTNIKPYIKNSINEFAKPLLNEFNYYFNIFICLIVLLLLSNMYIIYNQNILVNNI